MTEIYVHRGDIGTIFRLSIVDTDGEVVDVSTATVKYIYFQKPTAVNVKKTAAFYTDGTDGIIQYTTIANDIAESGTWSVQGYVETTLGKFFTVKSTFQVYKTLYTAA